MTQRGIKIHSRLEYESSQTFKYTLRSIILFINFPSTGYSTMARLFYEVSEPRCRNLTDLSGYSADMVAALVVAFGIIYANSKKYLSIEETKNKGNGLRCRKVYVLYDIHNFLTVTRL